MASLKPKQCKRKMLNLWKLWKGQIFAKVEINFVQTSEKSNLLGRTYWIRGWIMRPTLSDSAPIHLGFISEIYLKNSHFHMIMTQKYCQVFSILKLESWKAGSIFYICSQSVRYLSSKKLPRHSGHLVCKHE